MKKYIILQSDSRMELEQELNALVKKYSYKPGHSGGRVVKVVGQSGTQHCTTITVEVSSVAV